MKKLLLLSAALLISVLTFGQNKLTSEEVRAIKKQVRIFGAIPTANKNMHWVNNNTPEETYVGIIKADSSNATEIIDAFRSTFQAMQDVNLMTKQMETKAALATTFSAGNNEEVDRISKWGAANVRNGYANNHTFTVRFIDGVRLIRFYFDVNLQAKDGRFKLVITPIGVSAFNVDNVQTSWPKMFTGMYKSSCHYNDIKIKLAFTVDQWIKKAKKQLNKSKSNW